MSLIAALVLGGLVREDMPPEWLAYQKVLKKAGSYSLFFKRVTSFDPVSQRLLGSSGQLFVERPGRFRLDQDDRRYYWDGKSAVFADSRTNELRPAGKPIRSMLIEVLDPFGAGEYWKGGLRTTTRLPRRRKQTENGQIETGFMVKSSGIDATSWTEYWFDPHSHLPIEITVGASGMTESFQATYVLDWSLHAVPASALIPARFSDAERNLPEDGEGIRLIPWPDAPEGKGRLRVVAPTGASGHLQIEDAEFEIPTASMILLDGPKRISTGAFGDSFPVRSGFETVVSLGAISNRTKDSVRLWSNGVSAVIKRGETIAILPGSYEWRAKKVVVRPGNTETLDD